MSRMRKSSAALISILMAATACAADQAASSEPRLIVSEPWIRTTDETQRPDMTAMFVNLTNPTDSDITLTGADCGDVAQRYELHVMESKDGQMVMVEAEDGIVVPAEKHEHLAPGGPHIMLMELNRELPVGSEEIDCTLTFDNGQEETVKAPVMEFTEEQDTYHEH